MQIARSNTLLCFPLSLSLSLSHFLSVEYLCHLLHAFTLIETHFASNAGFIKYISFPVWKCQIVNACFYSNTFACSFKYQYISNYLSQDLSWSLKLRIHAQICVNQLWLKGFLCANVIASNQHLVIYVIYFVSL